MKLTLKDVFLFFLLLLQSQWVQQRCVLSWTQLGSAQLCGSSGLAQWDMWTGTR